MTPEIWVVASLTVAMVVLVCAPIIAMAWADGRPERQRQRHAEEMKKLEIELARAKVGGGK